MPVEVLQELVGDLNPGSALDLAAGDGGNTVFLAQHGWELTAVDFSAERIRLARERVTEAGVDATRVVSDARDYQPGRRFDLVVITYLHLAEAENRAIMARAASWVAPGGHLLVLGHDKANLAGGAPGPRRADILYTTELLRAYVVGLTVVRCELVFRHSAVDPERPGEVAATAVDTLLFATRRILRPV
jgi:2-polyprenyl-3-methyl-5-hydroxy-6-metoxy-1,4-benzoquinol methylase